MRFSKILLLACLLTGLAVTAQAAVKGQVLRTASASGNVYELTIAAERLETMAPLPVTLSITNAAGAPVKGAKVSCTLTMPAMAMPNNAPPIKAAEPGRYEGIFLLTMGGVWHVNLATVYGSGENDNVVFEIVAATPAKAGGVDSQLEELFHTKKPAQ